MRLAHTSVPHPASSPPHSETKKAGAPQRLGALPHRLHNRRMFAIIWRFEIWEAHRADFEAAYGPTGDWARLFARSGGFRGTELMRADDGTYLTLDVWRAKADFEAFLADHRPDYEALDRRTEPWTRAEHRIGEYEVLEEASLPQK